MQNSYYFIVAILLLLITCTENKKDLDRDVIQNKPPIEQEYFPMRIEKKKDSILYLNNIKSLEKVTHLYIVNNSNLQEIIISSRLKNLKFLRIRKNRTLKNISGYKNMENVEEIELVNNGIEKLPHSFSSLKNLISIVIRRSKMLTQIDGVKNLPKLKDIEIAKSGVVSIPETFSSLTSLEKITIRQNFNLNSVEGIKNFNNLTYLRLDYGNGDFFKNLSSLPNIKELELSNTRNFYLGEIVEKLNLENAKINTSKNKMTGFEALTELENLKISNHNISELFSSINGIQSLKKLILINNYLDIDSLIINDNIEDVEIKGSISSKSSSWMLGFSRLKTVRIDEYDGEILVYNLPLFPNVKIFINMQKQNI